MKAESNACGTAVCWKRFKDAWENYSIATGLNEKDEKIQLATLLSIIGEHGIERFNNYKLQYPDKVKKMKDVMELFENDFKAKTNILYERYQFLKRK